jgi:hypothetical protein
MHPLSTTGRQSARAPNRVMLDDETLRDGLQSPSVRADDRAGCAFCI